MATKKKGVKPKAGAGLKIPGGMGAAIEIGGKVLGKVREKVAAGKSAKGRRTKGGKGAAAGTKRRSAKSMLKGFFEKEAKRAIRFRQGRKAQKLLRRKAMVV